MKIQNQMGTFSLKLFDVKHPVTSFCDHVLVDLRMDGLTFRQTDVMFRSECLLLNADANWHGNIE